MPRSLGRLACQPLFAFAVLLPPVRLSLLEHSFWITQVFAELFPALPFLGFSAFPYLGPRPLCVVLADPVPAYALSWRHRLVANWLAAQGVTSYVTKNACPARL